MNAIKFFAAILIFLQATCALAATKKPVRIVCLPIIFQNKIDRETRNELEFKLSRAVHIPLNETLDAAEYLDAENSAATFQKILRDNKNFPDAVKILAENLDADLIICANFKRYSQSAAPSLSIYGESRLHSEVAAEMIIYDRRDENLIHKKISRSHHGEFNKFRTAKNLAAACLDALIRKTNLKEIIGAIR